MNVKTVKHTVALLLSLAAFAAHAVEAPPPSMGVSPSRLEVDVSAGRTATGSATVLNMSDRDIHISTEVVSFDLDENNEFRPLPPEPGGLPTALMMNPVEFTVPANGSQIVRFAIMPERLQGAGEHRAMIFFSEVVGTSHSSVKVRFRLGMPLYAVLGDAERTASLHDVAYEPAKSSLEFDLTATGTAQVKPSGFYVFWPAADFPSESKALEKVADLARHPSKRLPKSAIGGRIMTKPVFPGARRTLTAALPEPPDRGEYKLVYVVEAGGQSVQRVVDYVPSDAVTLDSD